MDYGLTQCEVCDETCREVGTVRFCGDGTLDADSDEVCDDGMVPLVMGVATLVWLKQLPLRQLAFNLRHHVRYGAKRAKGV